MVAVRKVGIDAVTSQRLNGFVAGCRSRVHPRVDA